MQNYLHLVFSNLSLEIRLLENISYLEFISVY